jgi:hypothetical protein
MIKIKFMKTIKYFALLLVPCFAFCLASCTKTTGDAYKKFEKGGEITYPGRADSVFVYSGNNRVKLSIVLGNDPLVTKIRVFYNNMQDSTETPVTRTLGVDTVNIIVDKLTEGNYNFIIYTYDIKGNKSVVSNASGVVYGSSYTASLANRNLKLAYFDDDGKATIDWGNAASDELGVQLTYINTASLTKTIVVPKSETYTKISGVKPNSQLTFRSLFKPDSTAFETFSPAVATAYFSNGLNKSKFKSLILPTDVLEGGYGWLEEFLWDDNYNPPGFATESKVPCWFTFDSGIPTAITGFKVWQANDRLYDLQSVKAFELHGSNNPNPDGSWGSWTKIGSYESMKPSGLAVGTNSDADVAFALRGESFPVIAGTPKFRYFRFKLLSNFGNGDFMTMEEFSFFTNDH